MSGAEKLANDQEIVSRVRAKTIEDFAPPKKRVKKPSNVPPKEREKLAREEAELREEGRWDEYKSGHVVALYAACYEKCYGIGPLELESGKDYALARFAASRVARDHFKDDAASFIEFIRWSWVREYGREKWRRDNNREGGRISWRYQFSNALVSDYLLSRHRRTQNQQKK